MKYLEKLINSKSYRYLQPFLLIALLVCTVLLFQKYDSLRSTTASLTKTVNETKNELAKATDTQTTSTLTKSTTGVSRDKLTITEWGVTMDQPSKIGKLIYQIDKPDKDGVQSLKLGFDGLSQIDNLCGFSYTDFGIITRFASTSYINLGNGQRRTVADIESDSSVSVNLNSGYGFYKVGKDYYKLSGNGFSNVCGGKEAKAFITALDAIPIDQIFKTLQNI